VSKNVRSSRNDNSDSFDEKVVPTNACNRRRNKEQNMPSNYPFAAPTMNHIDDLCVISDESLFVTFTNLSQQRNELLRQRFSTFLWDVELAYVQRESKIRSDRRIAHKSYLDKVSSETAFTREVERHLPEFESSGPMEFYN
jgi:hypothetical protein